MNDVPGSIAWLHRQTWIQIVPVLRGDWPDMWFLPPWVSNLAWLCTKHTKCCFNSSQGRENITLHEESLITWVSPQGADIRQAIQGQGCCFPFFYFACFFFLKPNTRHRQSLCHLGYETPGLLRRHVSDENTTQTFLIACFFKADLHINPPLTAASCYTGRWPGNLRRIRVWHVVEMHPRTLSGASLWYGRASQGAAI